MKNIDEFSEKMSAEDFLAFTDVLEKKAQLNLDFNKLKKKYSGVKTRIKKIVLRVAELETEENNITPNINFIAYQGIERIENKYKDVDKHIRYYNQHSKDYDLTYKRLINTAITNSESVKYAISNLNIYISSGEIEIKGALRHIAITDRYFKDIYSFFEHKRKMKMLDKMRQMNKKPPTPAPDDAAAV